MDCSPSRGLRVGYRVPNRPVVCWDFVKRLYINIYILLTTESIGRVLMLLSICVEAEFAEERTEDHDTTSSQPRRPDRGGFPYDIL